MAIPSMPAWSVAIAVLAPPAEWPEALTYLAVAYLAAAAAAWLVVPERFTCMTPRRGVPLRDRPAPPGPPATSAPSAAGALRSRPAATPTAAQRLSLQLAGNLTTGVRLTLMAMALPMSWMMPSMQQMAIGL